MKHIKLFENFEKDKHVIASDVESVLAELRDNGLEVSIAPPDKIGGYLYISITDEDEETFWFDSIIMNRLLFLNDYLKSKYKNVTMKVNDDFMEPTEFPFSIEEFSDEIMNIEIQIYF